MSFDPKAVFDRVGYLPALFGSGASFLGAAALAGVAAPQFMVPAALVVLAQGLGAVFINEFHKAFHDLSDKERARRNHLIRRGMAQALHDSLLRAQTSFPKDIPAGLGTSFFRYWPDLLARAQTDDELIDALFPPEHSEDQWNLLNRYYEDLNAVKQSALPADQKALLFERESKDEQALASLLRNLPVRDSDDEMIHLFRKNLGERLPQEASLAFAAKLLPLYRLSFAAIFSQGGELRRAIGYTGEKLTLERLEAIQLELQAGFESLGKQIEGVSGQVSGVAGELAEVKAMLAALLDQKTKSGEVPPGVITAENRQAKIEEVVSEIPKVVEEIRQSSSPVATANVEELLAAGKLDDAAKAAEAEFDHARKAYAEQGRNFARASFDMGRINELSFRWTAALENYRQAWELSGHENAEYGFKLAHFAAKLNHHREAISTFEAVLPLYTLPSDVASTLNNLGVLYTQTHRHVEAETVYTEALTLYRKLAAANPAAYEPRVARTLGNLGGLYRKTQRHAEAETVYTEALTLFRKLGAESPVEYEPDVAALLNNLGALYWDTRRHAEAETVYTEALTLRRKLAAANPAAYEPDAATTLNNLGILYADTHRHGEAGTAYTEALTLRRKLTAANPAAQVPDLAATLNNLGNLYKGTQRHDEAEAALTSALVFRRMLAAANPATYEPDVAATLNDLANLYANTQRHVEAEKAYAEALALYRKLAAANPAAYEPDLATTLYNLGRVDFLEKKTKPTEMRSSEAEKVLAPWQRANPRVHANQMAKIFWLRALVRESSGDRSGALEFAGRGFDTADDPALKAGLRQLIDHLSSPPSEQTC